MLCLSAVWFASLLIVNPIGDFPLNDDWSFGRTVKHWLDSGEFRPAGWFPMPFLTNAIWGYLFCSPFGFSFTVLRSSTLTLSWVGILGTYALVRQTDQPRWLAVLIALTLAFNPLYYALSNTFMTDVPFSALMILAGIFFARALKSDSYVDLLIATAFATAATLSRQLGLASTIAFTITAVLVRRPLTIRCLLRASTPPIVAGGALLLFQRTLQASHRLPAVYQARTEYLANVITEPSALLHSQSMVPKNLHLGALYLGLFLLPVLIFLVAKILQSHKKQGIILLCLAAGLLALRSGVLVSRNRSLFMPLSHNVLIGSGIGPLTLRDTYILSLDNVPWLGWGFWFVVTAMSAIGATLLIALVTWATARFVRDWWLNNLGANRVVGLFFLLTGIVYLGPLVITSFYDRYLVPLIPFFAIAIACACDQGQRAHRETLTVTRWVSLATLLAMTVFAIGATRDYLAWNRLRWEAIHHLMNDRGIAATSIDGGFEFGGLYLSGSGRRKLDPTKSWWWVRDDTYLIAFGNVPGYETLKEYQYFNWIGPRVGKILVLQKIAAKPPDP